MTSLLQPPTRPHSIVSSATITTPRTAGRYSSCVVPRGAIRVGVVLGVVLLVFALWALRGAEMTGATEHRSAPVEVIIAPGDTLWDLATEHRPENVTILEYVRLVERHNNVRSGALVPGRLLELPQDV